MQYIERQTNGHYFGRLCKVHPEKQGERYGANGICIDCSNERANQSEAGRNSKRKYKNEHPELRAQESKKWREEHPERSKISNKRSKYLSKYGLTLNGLVQIFDTQEGKCAICNSLIILGGKAGAKVDHCHKTGMIRGILCSLCNTGLGHFKDNITYLSSAIEYLKRAEGEIGIV
jgi:Autographiviridae endonuclease VII